MTALFDVRLRGRAPRKPAEAAFRRTRRVVSACLAALLLAAAASPHRHKNGLADLLTDGLSDSGVFVDASSLADRGSPLVERLRWVDDEPCLACFPSDFAAAPTATAVEVADLLPLDRSLTILPRHKSSQRTRLRASRSPPRL